MSTKNVIMYMYDTAFIIYNNLTNVMVNVIPGDGIPVLQNCVNAVTLHFQTITLLSTFQ